MKALHVLAAAALASAATPAPAAAAQFTGPGGAWAAASVVHVPGPPGPPITVSFDPPPGLDARTAAGEWDPTTSTAYVHDRLGPSGPEGVLWHELGHADDARALWPAARAAFLGPLGYAPDVEWTGAARWPADPYCTHTECPNERYADLYEGCALGFALTVPSGQRNLRRGDRAATAWWSPYGLTLTTTTYVRLCRMIRDDNEATR